MKKSFNLGAIIVGLILLVVGLVFVITQYSILVNIGCSLIASGIVLIITTVFIDYRKDYMVWTEWKLEKIFKTRADKNNDSDPKLEKHNVKQLDGICFGLRSFRSNRRNDLLTCMQRGMNVRLLVMNPTGPFVKQREIEEGVAENSISKSIEDLIKWANELNKLSQSGKIKIKYYDSMTLDFYWRIDDDIYIGPYLLNVESQQTITYKYVKGGRGFQLYSDYFESLWNDIDMRDVAEE